MGCRQVLTEQVGRLVDGIVDGRQLCIDAGRAAWLAYLDIYVLDAGASFQRRTQRKLDIRFEVLCTDSGMKYQGGGQSVLCMRLGLGVLGNECHIQLAFVSGPIAA